MAPTPSVSLFVIIPTPSTPDLDDLIPNKFKKASYRLPLGEWLVAYRGTTRQLTEALQIDKENHGNAVVLSIASYWGRTNPEVWEWFKQYSE